MSESIEIKINEACNFCNSNGEYWEFEDSKIISVCRKHIKMEASS
jgi:hypothetical protein